VDSITHAALGAVVGELTLGRQLGRRSLAWGALVATIPDLEAFLLPFFDTVWDLRLHRGISHSILLTLLLPFLLAKPLAKRWKRNKVTPQRAGWFIFLAWSTHVLIDVFTTYGTQVFAPFHRHPAAFDNLFIIDPLFTQPLIVAVVWAFFIKKPEWKKGRGFKIAAWCLGISCAYVGLSFAAKFSVGSAIKSDLARRDVSYQRKMETPAPFNILLWRCLIDRGDELWLGYRSIFDDDTPIHWTIIDKGTEHLDLYQNAPEVREVRRFSKDWLYARRTSDGLWMVDARIGESRRWDKRGLALRPYFAWEYRVHARGDRLRQTNPGDFDLGEIMSRMSRRIRGDLSAWEGPPRLVGNPGALQEYLTTAW